MNKFESFFVNILKARKPKAPPKYGEGKHKQGVLVRTPSGKIVTEQRTVGVTKKDKKPKNGNKQPALVSPPPPAPTPPPVAEKPKRGQPAGLRKHQAWQKQKKQNDKIASDINKHLEGVDMGEFERPMEYPQPKKSKPQKEKPKPVQSIAEKEKEILAEKPKKEKPATPVKPIASVGKQGLKSNKNRQEAEARQGMFDEESDLARAMVGDGEKKDWVKDYINSQKNNKEEHMDSVFPSDDDDDDLLLDYDENDPHTKGHERLGNLAMALHSAGISSHHAADGVVFNGRGGQKFFATYDHKKGHTPFKVNEFNSSGNNGGFESIGKHVGHYDHIHDLVEKHFGKKMGEAIIDSAHDSSPILSKSLSRDYQDTKAFLSKNKDMASSDNVSHFNDSKVSHFKLGGHDGVKRNKSEIEAMQKHAIENGARYSGYGDVWSIGRNKEGHDALLEKHGGAMKKAFVKADSPSKINVKPNAVGKLEGKLEEKKGQTKSAKEQLADRKRLTAETKKQLAQNDKTSAILKKQGAGYYSNIDEGDYANPNAPDPLANKSMEKLKEATAKAKESLKEVGAKPKPSSKSPQTLQGATKAGQKALVQTKNAGIPTPPSPSKPVEVKNVVQAPSPKTNESGYSGNEFKEKTYIDSTHDTVNMSPGMKGRLGVQQEKDANGKTKHFVDFSKLSAKDHQRAVNDLNKHKQTPVKVTQGQPRK